MRTLNATTARQQFFDVIRSATEKHETIQIHHKKGDVVMMSRDEYEGLMETLHLQSIPGFAESIQKSIKQVENGEVQSFEAVFGEPQ